MKKNNASPEIIEAYQADDENWESSNMLFCLLATSIEDRTKEEKRKSTVKKKKKVGKGSSIVYDDNNFNNQGYSPVRGAQGSFRQ